MIYPNFLRNNRVQKWPTQSAGQYKRIVSYLHTITHRSPETVPELVKGGLVGEPVEPVEGPVETAECLNQR